MIKIKMFISIAVLSIVIGWPGTVLAQSTREQPIPPRPATAVSPLIERYMLDELKASDMKNHLDLQKATLDNAVDKVKLLMMTKVGKA